MKEKTHLVRNRCLFSIVIILIYFVCHRIPLNGIDMSAYDNLSLDLGAVLSLAVNGSNKQCYVMSLGISPYITASLIVMILFAVRSKEAKARTSPKAMNYWITSITFIVALVQSIFYALGLKYIDRNIMSILVALFELMAGASIAQFLLMKNKKYGVGGFAGADAVDYFVQAKRNKPGTTIPIEKVRALRGVMPSGSKGIFITTANYSKKTEEFVDADPSRPIILIDGNHLLKAALITRLVLYLPLYSVKMQWMR